MEQCESKIGGVCGRPATWKQAVHAGERPSGRVLFHSYWCDDHAEKITQRRRREHALPPIMAPIAEATT
jgi:hypothetical protein